MRYFRLHRRFTISVLFILRLETPIEDCVAYDMLLFLFVSEPIFTKRASSFTHRILETLTVRTHVVSSTEVVSLLFNHGIKLGLPMVYSVSIFSVGKVHM